MTDLELLKLLSSGEQIEENRALRVLFQRNMGTVKRYVLANSGSEEEAMELIQDSIVALFFNARKASFVLTAKFDTYLFAIAKNLWYKQLRKKKHQISTESLEVGHAQIGVEIEESLFMDEKGPMQRLLAQMTTRCKEVLSMIFIHDLGIKEIQEQLAYASEQAVRNKKSECLTRLRELYMDQNTGNTQ